MPPLPSPLRSKMRTKKSDTLAVSASKATCIVKPAKKIPQSTLKGSTSSIEQDLSCKTVDSADFATRRRVEVNFQQVDNNSFSCLWENSLYNHFYVFMFLCLERKRQRFRKWQSFCTRTR